MATLADTPIEFPESTARRRFHAHRDTAFRVRATEPDPILLETTAPRQGPIIALIGIDNLYPYSPGAKSDIIKALGLLSDAIGLLEQARAAAQRDEPIEADRYLQRFQLILPQLFSCRTIGDGYAVIINSLHFAFVNLRGKTLDLDEITTVWRVLRALRTRPFLSLNEALEYVGEMEAADLAIDPPVLSEILKDPGDD